MLQVIKGVILLSLCFPCVAAVLTHDATFDPVVPSEAYQGVGSWMTGDNIIATGHSTEMDSLGPGKDKRTEQEWALDDCKRRIMVQVAASKDISFDEDFYDLAGEVKGFATAATFKIDGREGLFLIGVANKNQVSVHAEFNPKKARTRAIDLFDAEKYKEAAVRFADLTQRGIQDDETVAYARAASWHVNLESGISGSTRTEALDSLGQFYYERQNYEASLQHFYALYLITQEPDVGLIKRLIDLCEKTHRDETAAKFDAELAKLQGYPKPELVIDLKIDKQFAPILVRESMLLTNAGAKIVQHKGVMYFFAVGSTDIRGDSGEEHLRQIKVARAQAQKGAVSFAEGTDVIAEENSTEKTVITQKDGQKTATSLKEYDESIQTKVKGVIHSLNDIGTWKSPDGKVFFFAIGCQLN